MGTPLLIVDDDEILGRILGRVLKGLGYTVWHALNGEQALRLAREHHPLLGLVDLCMPGLGGVELAQRLQGEQPDLPLILMTAFPLRVADQPALARYFVRVLIKPLDLAVLRQAVEEALPCGANRAGLVKLP